MQAALRADRVAVTGQAEQRRSLSSLGHDTRLTVTAVPLVNCVPSGNAVIAKLSAAMADPRQSADNRSHEKLGSQPGTPSTPAPSFTKSVVASRTLWPKRPLARAEPVL